MFACIDAGDPDPAFNDASDCAGPPYGTERNDMGAHGGPGACWSLASSCYADCDCSATLDLFDFLCFVNAFNAGSAYADCDGSGGLNLFDFLCYVGLFNAGC